MAEQWAGGEHPRRRRSSHEDYHADDRDDAPARTPPPKEPESAAGPSALLANVARAGVLALTILWATNFPVIKGIYQSGLTPPDYAVLRFSLAAAALVPLARWDNRELLIGSAQCGMWVSAGYMTQAVALTTASANKGAFICACQVIFVAMLNAVQRRQFVPRTWIAALLAVSGVGMLELAGPVEPELTDLWCLGMPICFGMGYVRLEELMEHYPRDARTVSALKVAVVGATALLWCLARAIASGNGFAVVATRLMSPSLPWLSLLYTGLITTAGAILVESYAFKYVPATDAAVILATEPLWAALFSAWFLGETLTATDVLGGALVIGACIVNEMKSLCGPAQRDGTLGEKVPLLVAPSP
jgi:drug/metabolite transporter (DMT)-like permease